ncbi:protein UBASH3A homolog [Varroa destructor]|uniref:Ecdysteroid-phosphate phosphatase n=1 Tax=Varroa destructor TaxID=109461 RepID=A0A7M7JLQ1_VARDE|nr:protein UBASH3A homolog [Varroa destructor]
MAAVLLPPPRRTSGRMNRNPQTALQVLLQMGFPKHRAEKALAATGDRGVQLAADWLLSHVNDPTLDSCSPREYILYLCPTGPLLGQLQNFFLQSMLQHERNGAHNYLPHITLCSFFQLPDDGVAEIVRALEVICERLRGELPEKIRLEHYTSQTFLGLFVDQKHNEMLKKISVAFMRETADLQLSVEPYLKALHVTLAYQFDVAHYGSLEKLTQMIDTEAPACWELRLYSRDTRVKGNEVHKVLYSHVPHEADELELLIGDFVYVNGDKLNKSTDGWVEGTSWLTGCSGFLPKNYIERTAESDAWTLHKSFIICKSTFSDDMPRPPSSPLSSIVPVQSLQEQPATPAQTTQPAATNSIKPTPVERKNVPQLSSTNSGASSNSCDPPSPKEDTLYENVNFLSLKPNGERRLKRLYVVRHAERIDFTFGPWIKACFDQQGNYAPKDLNMPKTVLPRKPMDYLKDSPLTRIGLFQATLTGEAMYEAGVRFSQVFCSPSLRCVQTATNILKALKSATLINIEPGLFEWLAWYPDVQPVWFKPMELKEFGFPINPTYKPLVSVDELLSKKFESCEQYFNRSHIVTQTLLETSKQVDGDIMFLGHSATLDVCTRQLTGGRMRTPQELVHIVHKIPYVGVACVEEEPSRVPRWGLVAPSFETLTHASNVKYDWRCMLGDAHIAKR